MSAMTGPETAPHAQKALDRMTIEPAGKRLRAVFNGTVIAESEDALVLAEDGYPPRIYFPPEAVNRAHLTPTDHGSRCPWKGEAAYWTVTAGDRSLENGAWAYPAPLDDVAVIKDHVSFYDEVTVGE